MFESQLERSAQELGEGQGKGKDQEKVYASDRAFPAKVKKYYINFIGNFGMNHITPRGLKANLVNEFVSV